MCETKGEKEGEKQVNWKIRMGEKSREHKNEKEMKNEKGIKKSLPDYIRK